MAYELTWHFDANRSRTPASADELTQYNIWYLASFLMGDIGGATLGLWTYQGSSDGTTADMSGVKGNWKWGTPGTFDASKIVQIAATPATSAHSWIVLRSPVMPNGGYTYLLIEAYGANNAAYSIYTSITPWSLAATPTWRPTSATYTPPTVGGGAQTANDGLSAPHTFNGCLADNGQFFVFDIKTGTGNTRYGNIVIWAPVEGALSADNYPFYFFHGYDASYGFAIGVDLNAGVAGRQPARLGNGNSASAFNLVWSPGVTTNAALRDYLTGGLWDMPFLVFASGSAGIHARGRVKDLAYMPYDGAYAAMCPAGTLIKEAGAIKYVTLDSLIVPFDASLLM